MVPMSLATAEGLPVAPWWAPFSKRLHWMHHLSQCWSCVSESSPTGSLVLFGSSSLASSKDFPNKVIPSRSRRCGWVRGGKVIGGGNGCSWKSWALWPWGNWAEDWSESEDGQDILFSSIAPGCIGCCAQTNFIALQSLGCDHWCCASNGSSLNLESLLGRVGILSSPGR